MMTQRFLAFTAMAGALMLASCDKGPEKLAKGQVVASVNGEDITVHELNAELAFAKVPRDGDRKQFEAAALQRIIDRKIVADIAREQGLDKTQNYVLQKLRAEDMLLVSMLQRQIAGKVGTPSRVDAEQYVEAHPGMFADRMIYSVDQILFRPNDTQMLKDISDLKSIDDLQNYLNAKQVRFRRAPGTLDAARMDPAILTQIRKLPDGEVFVVPLRGELVASTITGSRAEPLVGEPAVRLAMNLLQSERVQKIAKQQLDPKIEAARKTVRYQSGYGPEDSPPAAKAAPATKG